MFIFLMVSSFCHGHDNNHVKIQTRDLLGYNQVLCVNQHVQYTIMLFTS